MSDCHSRAAAVTSASDWWGDCLKCWSAVTHQWFQTLGQHVGLCGMRSERERKLLTEWERTTVSWCGKASLLSVGSMLTQCFPVFSGYHLQMFDKFHHLVFMIPLCICHSTLSFCQFFGATQNKVPESFVSIHK